jgi:hypothetical protein
VAGGEREIRIRCPHCRAICTHAGELSRDVVAFCGNCHGVITRELKRAFFRNVSADISARLVAKDNREFLAYLHSGWSRSGEDEASDGRKG